MMIGLVYLQYTIAYKLSKISSAVHGTVYRIVYISKTVFFGLLLTRRRVFAGLKDRLTLPSSDSICALLAKHIVSPAAEK